MANDRPHTEAEAAPTGRTAMPRTADAEWFADAFFKLTGHAPFRWQSRLFMEWFAQGRVPTSCDIPTGLGKTSVIAISVLALAYQSAIKNPTLPRRLVYVVNRRTVVDQATEVAVGMRDALRRAARGEGDAILRGVHQYLSDLCAHPEGEPLSISTLRGELADNREWQTDPARAAVIVGTPDMIGSRLLFSGYGVSRRMRPFHAGLLGQDSLIIHDEAHLTPAFGSLLHKISGFQEHEPRPLRVIELSATRRAATDSPGCFVLSAQEEEEAEVARRLNAKKTLRLSTPENADELPGKLAELALAHEQNLARVLVYVKSPKGASRIADIISKSSERVALLTGTMRGYERDEMTSTPLEQIAEESARRRAEVFRGFRTDPDCGPPEQTEYLVSTSAGEVGVDLNADHLICDASTLDSMIQRLGRVNRLGRGAAMIDVVQTAAKDEDSTDEPDRVKKTVEALKSLPAVTDGYDASPRALRLLAGRDDAFSKPPRIVPVTDILLDAWAMTRLKDLPGRPPVERWLHGIEASPPEMYVAWRADVGYIHGASGAMLSRLFEEHPIHSRERLRGSVTDVVAELAKIAKRYDGARGILIPASGNPAFVRLSEMRNNDERLREATIMLPPEVGGLDARGILNAKQTTTVIDVADGSYRASDSKEPERLRVFVNQDPETEELSARPVELADSWNLGAAASNSRNLRDAMKAVRGQLESFLAEKSRLVLGKSDEGEPTKVLLLFARPRSVDLAQDSSAAAARSQELEEHLEWTRCEGERIASKLMLKSRSPDLAEAISLSARGHDRGKNRGPWQKAIGHSPPPAGDSGDAAWKPWAKSGKIGFDASACGRYRHEFGSLREATADSEIVRHPERDLILHLIAAHHGWSRPHFEPDQWDIADDVTDQENADVAVDAMRRFARLQRRFGRWGLAYLESLMRSADYAATRRLSTTSDPCAETPA